ncbi:MAG: SUMF1/EgtB/PvdO family nonheme iron enzyme [Candidatus Hatepunaea meridiana]|nr:SUMF1/EgtB/PvdO family nonheme iron enzyme [Candidatus Hatepunaea meridiana]
MKSHTRFFTFTLSCFLTFILVISCVDTPTEPVADNPLDANNSGTSGDPYRLSTEIADGGVRLTWQAVDVNDLAGYNVYRKENNSAFSQFHQVNSTTTTYTDRTIQNGHRYEYYVVAHSATGEGDASNVAKVSINADPVIYIAGENATHTPTRNVTLTILAFGAEQMRLSNSEGFSNSVWEAYSTTKEWELLTGEGTKNVYLSIIYDTNDTSSIASDDIDPTLIEPTVIINNDAEYTEIRLVTLSLTGLGVTEMKIENVEPPSLTSTFSNSMNIETNYTTFKSKSTGRESLHVRNIQSPNRDETTEDWQPFEESIEWELLIGEDVKNIEVTVRNEFLIEETCSDNILPRLSEALNIAIANSDTVQTNHVSVRVEAEYADSMQIGVDDQFTEAVWVPFVPNFNWDLGKGELIVNELNGRSVRSTLSLPTPSRDGSDETEYTLYARVKNEFEVPSNTISDDVTVEIFGAISIDDGADSTASRFVDLQITVAQADSMALSNDSLVLIQDPTWIEISSHFQNWALQTGEGQKTVFARFKNISGAESQIYSDYIEPLLPMDPSISIVDEDEDGFTALRIVDLSLFASGENLRMRLSENGEFEGAAWEEFAESKQFELSTGAGEKIIHVCFKNDFELESDVVNCAIAPLPINPTMTIQDSAEFTLTRDISVSFTAEGVIDSMLVSVYEDFHDVNWVEFSEEIDVELLAGSGVKVVYARLWNNFEIESEIITDMISPMLLQPNLTINGDAEITNDSVLRLYMQNVGALRMQVSESEDFDDADWIEYQEEYGFEVDDGFRIIFVQFQNDFFQSENLVKDTIFVDTQVEIEAFSWSSENEGPIFTGDNFFLELEMSDDAISAEIDGTALVRIEGFEEDIELEEVGEGHYQADYEISENDGVFNGEVSILFTDRASNMSESIAEERIFINCGDEGGFEHSFSLTDNINIVMCWIPPGEFRMGSPDDEDERNDSEGPVHDVHFGQGFWMGKYEVTQAQWEAVTDNNPARNYGVGDSHPVYYVNWVDIQEFEESLDDYFRLPSEAEWEYACRAGTNTRFYWGDDPDYEDIDDYAIYDENSNGLTQEVGTKEPNAWGLYDMSGNVWEWCEDGWHGNYNGAPDDGTPWFAEPGHSFRSYRGGGFAFWGACHYVRSACRRGQNRTSDSMWLGFRLAKSLR